VQTPLKDFIRAETSGLPCIVKFYNEWSKGIHQCKEHCVISYENFKDNTLSELKKLLSFLHLTDIPEAILINAIEQSSFQRMQKMEREGEFTSHRMRPSDTKDVQTFKTRKGIVGGHRKECSQDDIQFMDAYIHENLTAEFGYK